MNDPRITYVADMVRQVTDTSATVIAVVALAAQAQYDRKIDCPACDGLGRSGLLTPCPVCLARGSVAWGEVYAVGSDA